MPIFQSIVTYVFFRAEHEPTKPNLPPVKEGDGDGFAPRYRWRYFFTYLISLLFSGATIATVVLLLRTYEGNQAPTWGKNITLNTAVAWLAAVARLTIVVPLAECIGQAKWGLFERRRKLSNIELGDAVGRDPFHALSWIVRFRGGALLHFGAALVIVSLGFDPALQHMVSYELVSVPDAMQNASVAVNTNYSPVRGLDRGLVFATPKSVLYGAYSAILGSEVEVDWSCPTGNCTFPAMDSVAICSSCEDATARIKRTCKDVSEKNKYCISQDTCFTSGQLCTYRDGSTKAEVGGGNSFLDLRASGVGFANDSDGKITIPRDVVNLTVLYIQPDARDVPDTGKKVDTRLPTAPGHVAGGSKDPIRAYTCALSYCSKHFSTTATQGKLSETSRIASNSKDSYSLDRPNLSDITDALFDGRIALTDANSTSVSVAAVYAMSQGFSATLTGNSSIPDSALPAPGSYSEFHRALYEKLLTKAFPDMMDSMTRSMTNAIRNDGDTVDGIVFTHRIYVRVNWRWVALPAVLWSCVFAFVLGMTMQAKKKRKPWLGTSVLATSFIGLEELLRRDVEKSDAGWGDKDWMLRVAEGQSVRVAPGHSLSDDTARLQFVRADRIREFST